PKTRPDETPQRPSTRSRCRPEPARQRPAASGPAPRESRRAQVPAALAPAVALPLAASPPRAAIPPPAAAPPLGLYGNRGNLEKSGSRFSRNAFFPSFDS